MNSDASSSGPVIETVCVTEFLVVALASGRFNTNSSLVVGYNAAVARSIQIVSDLHSY